MKRFIVCVVSMFLMSHQADAKCTRLTHLTKKTIQEKGVKVETNKYDCFVKANEQGNFQDNYCKNCGCHTSDHDNA